MPTFYYILDSKVHMMWSQCCYSCDRSVSAKAVQLLVQLALQQSQCGSASSADLSQEAAMAIESLILCMSSSQSPSKEEKHLKVVLSSAVRLCRIASPDISASIVDCLTRLLLQASGSTLILICQALAAVGDTQPTLVVPALADIITLLKRLAGKGNQLLYLILFWDWLLYCCFRSDEDEMLAIPLLCVLLFQTQVGFSWSLECSQVVEQAVDKVDLWVVFRIGRSAAR